MVEFAERFPQNRPPAEPQPLPPSFTLRFEDVSFRYPGMDNLALEQINFTFEPGKTILVAGPSGAGKSTLFELLLGLWRPAIGRITAAGMEIERFDPQVWRQAWATLPQPARLISETLRQNLLLGQPEASDKDLAKALELAGAAPILRLLPEGLDAWIGEAGQQLSGGERQRIALARALVRQNQPLLLDEPTAHLDPVTSAQVLRNILSQANKPGALIISHWLAGLESVDEILVFEEGRITERGDHRTLMENHGWYAAQWRLQGSLVQLASLS